MERAVRDAETRAFELLVRRHQGLVRAQLRRLLGHHATMADNLAQDNFVLAWRKLKQFRGDSRFSTWLYRIAHSCFLQFLRRQNRQAEPVALDPDAGYPADADPRDLELHLDLTAALQLLPANQRAALLYCAQLGLSHQEAAEVLDVPLGTVKTHVTRGKARLRELLRDWAPNQARKRHMNEAQDHPERELDAWLRREFEGPVADDGFATRVMHVLPDARACNGDGRCRQRPSPALCWLGWPCRLHLF